MYSATWNSPICSSSAASSQRSMVTSYTASHYGTLALHLRFQIIRLHQDPLSWIENTFVHEASLKVGHVCERFVLAHLKVAEVGVKPLDQEGLPFMAAAALATRGSVSLVSPRFQPAPADILARVSALLTKPLRAVLSRTADRSAIIRPG